MEDRVLDKRKPVMSGLALWSYRLATWPLAVGGSAVILMFLSTSVHWLSSDFPEGLLYLTMMSAAMVLLLHSLVLAPLGMLLGIAALVQTARNPERHYGREYAKVAVIVGLIVCAYVVLMYVEGWPRT